MIRVDPCPRTRSAPRIPRQNDDFGPEKHIMVQRSRLWPKANSIVIKASSDETPCCKGSSNSSRRISTYVDDVLGRNAATIMMICHPPSRLTRLQVKPLKRPEPCNPRRENPSSSWNLNLKLPKTMSSSLNLTRNQQKVWIFFM